MAFETKEQVFEKIISGKKPSCPHCKVEMSIWEVPQIAFGDGLGWGVPYLFVCFNDDCPLYLNGWENIKEQYAHNASYRCMCYPGTEQYECMPVFSPMGGSGQIIDDQVQMEREMLKEAIKKGFSILAECYVSKDSPVALKMVLDATEPMRVRLKAAEIIGDIGESDAIDPLRNLKLGSEILEGEVDAAIKKIHGRYFTKECPFCAEIIKKKAGICKHCGREISGSANFGL